MAFFIDFCSSYDIINAYKILYNTSYNGGGALKVSSIKGMRDIMAPEVFLWQYIEETARDLFRLSGYSQIRTPVLEETPLFRRAIGEGTDIVNKEMYTFTDRGGRSVTLRPEGTAPIARAYIEHKMGGEGLSQLYYIGPMFRSERPQKGRSRQFHQIGAEAIGSSGPYIDVSVIQLLKLFFERLPLKDFKLKLCSLGCSRDKEALAASLKEFLGPQEARLCPDCKVRLKKNVLRTLDCKVESCRALLRNAPKAKDHLCDKCLTHYNEVKRSLGELGIEFTEDPYMVRGLDYYTNTVFEVVHPGLGAQDAIAAGGRYDGLISDFGGKPTGAFGFAVGIERLIMAYNHENGGYGKAERPEVFFVLPEAGHEAYAEAFRLRKSLLEDGIASWMNLEQRSMKAQMRQANKKGARIAVIIGGDELKRTEATVRDMGTKEQRGIPLRDVRQTLRARMRKLTEEGR